MAMGSAAKSAIQDVGQTQGQSDGGEAWPNTRATGKHAGVGDVKVVQVVAFTVSIHDGRGCIVPCGRCRRQSQQHSAELPLGDAPAVTSPLGQRVRFDRFEGVNPAVDETIVGFAVVVDVIDADLIVVQPHTVLWIRQHFGHGPPRHGT